MVVSLPAFDSVKRDGMMVEEEERRGTGRIVKWSWRRVIGQRGWDFGHDDVAVLSEKDATMACSRSRLKGRETDISISNRPLFQRGVKREGMMVEEEGESGGDKLIYPEWVGGES
jgi:hypothetical protein